MIRAISVGASLALVGCSSAEIDGKLVDGLTGKGISEVRVIAKAVSADVSMTCQAFDATTDENGQFNLSGVCTGTAYMLSLGDDTWWVPELKPVDDGGAVGLELTAWRNTDGEAIFRLAGDQFEGLKTHADVKADKIGDTEEVVRYPWPRIPASLPSIGPGEHLVMVGKETVGSWEILPLFDAANKVQLGEWTMEPWSYIGVKFGDTEKDWERVASPVDRSKVIVQETESRAGMYVPSEAVPPGRYAVLGPKSRTVSLVMFGAADGAMAQKVPEGEAEGE